jgi:hypothetical protein
MDAVGSGSHSSLVSGARDTASGWAAPLVPAPGKTRGAELAFTALMLEPGSVPRKLPETALSSGAVSYRSPSAEPQASGSPRTRDQSRQGVNAYMFSPIVIEIGSARTIGAAEIHT